MPSLGQWTISCSDGDQLAKAIINITADKQIKIIELTYSILFANGNQYESFTGGWGNTGYSISISNVAKRTNPKITSTAMILTGTSGEYQNYLTIVGTTNPIDLTNFSKLSVTASRVDSTSNPECRIAIAKTKNLNNLTASARITSVGTTNLDLTNIAAGSYYIAIYTGNVSSSDVYTRTFIITKITLEK